MVHASNKTTRKSHLTIKELRKRDAMALAQLILDIYKDKKRKEKENDTP